MALWLHLVEFPLKSDHMHRQNTHSFENKAFFSFICSHRQDNHKCTAPHAETWWIFKLVPSVCKTDLNRFIQRIVEKWKWIFNTNGCTSTQHLIKIAHICHELLVYSLWLSEVTHENQHWLWIFFLLSQWKWKFERTEYTRSTETNAENWSFGQGWKITRWFFLMESLSLNNSMVQFKTLNSYLSSKWIEI